MHRVSKLIAVALAVSTLLGIAACTSGATPTPVLTPSKPAAATPKPVAPTATAAPMATPATKAGASPSADSDIGRTVFAQNCNTCHPGGGRGVGPDIKGKSADVVKRVVRQGSGSMPAFSAAQISDLQLDALAAYISSLK